MAASGVSSSGPKYGLVAALLTRPSTRPKRSTALATSASTSSALPVWQAKAAAEPSGKLAAVASRSACLREASTTLAPAATQACAMAAPMPRLAPVTRMTLLARAVMARRYAAELAPARHRIGEFRMDLHHAAAWAAGVLQSGPPRRLDRLRARPLLDATQQLRHK